MVKPDPEAYSTQFSGTENEPQSQVSEAEGSDAQMTEDEKWGFTDKKGGMASETKLGIIIFAIVLCGLGFYGWKTFGGKKTNELVSTEPGGDGTTNPDNSEPGSLTPPTAGAEPDEIPSAFVTTASASDEDLFTNQSEPEVDPFAPPVGPEGVADASTARVELDPDDFGAMLEPSPASSGADLATTAAGGNQPDVGVGAFGGAFGGGAETQPLEPTVAAAPPQDDSWAAADTAESDVFGSQSRAAADPGAASVAAQPTGDTGDNWGTPAASAGTAQPGFAEQPTVDAREDAFDFGPGSIDQPDTAATVAAQPDDTYDPFAADPLPEPATGAVLRGEDKPFQPSGSDPAAAVAQPTVNERLAPRTLAGTSEPFVGRISRPTDSTDARYNSRPVASEQPAGTTTGNLDVTRSSNTGTYEVRRGDTFWSISKQVYGTSRYYRALAEHNARLIPDARYMPVGKRIETPAATQLETRVGTPPPRVASKPNRTTFDPNHGQGLYLDARDKIFYRVGTGDTLGRIAQQHLGRASRANDIQRLNRDQLPTSGAVLRPGMLLAMPDDASSVNSVRR